MAKLLSLFLCTGMTFGALSACAEEPGANRAAGDRSGDRAATADAQNGSATASVTVSRETVAPGHEANAAAIWVNPQDAGASRIYGTAGTAGIEVYDLEGQRVQSVETGGEIKGLDILPGFRTSDGPSALVVGLDVNTPSVLAYGVDPQDGTLSKKNIDGLEVAGAYEGVCAYQSNLDGEAYIFLAKGSGKLEQWWLHSTDGGDIKARPVRTLNMGSEVNFCAADPATNSLYVAEKEVGIWRLNADVETEVIPEVIDIVRYGNIDKEVGGLSVYRNDQGVALLVASNASADELHFYDINDDHALLGAAQLKGSNGVGDVNEGGGIAITNANLGGAFASGLLVIMDDDNGTDPTNYKLVPWGDLDGGAKLTEMATRNTEPAPQAKFVSVKPTLGTEPVAVPGDAADDPAVWVHPEDASRSLLVGTNKQGGLYVYDLDGKIVQYLEDGQINNVDVRYNFELGGESVDLVTASNRTDASIAIYTVDPDTGNLTDVADGTQPTDMLETYGQCMYQNPETRATYVFINDKSGLYRQWELKDSGDGKIRADRVRDFSVPSQPEGCVADDEYGVIYVGEEDEALWLFDAEPYGGTDGDVVVRISDNPAFKDDFEGVTLYYGENGAGYVIVSSQGNDSYAVFDRGGDHAYRGTFVIVANGDLDLDGASETDGIDVISTPLGDKFPYGLFIVQDGRNLMPAENQNYKVVPWESIADALDLEKYTGWDPRNATSRK